MKSYLLTTGTIFGLFSVGHIVELIIQWRSRASDPWFMGGMALIVVVSGAPQHLGFPLVEGDRCVSNRAVSPRAKAAG